MNIYTDLDQYGTYVVECDNGATVVVENNPYMIMAWENGDA